MVAVAVTVVVAAAALLAIPGVPGHGQAAMSADLLASDVGTVASEANPFEGSSSDPCAELEGTFGVGNHLFKNSRFGLYASVWPSYAALGDLYVTALAHGDLARAGLGHGGAGHSGPAGAGVSQGGAGCMSDFTAAVSSVDANYWTTHRRTWRRRSTRGLGRSTSTRTFPGWTTACGWAWRWRPT